MISWEDRFTVSEEEEPPRKFQARKIEKTDHYWYWARIVIKAELFIGVLALGLK